MSFPAFSAGIAEAPLPHLRHPTLHRRILSSCLYAPPHEQTIHHPLEDRALSVRQFAHSQSSPHAAVAPGIQKIGHPHIDLYIDTGAAAYLNVDIDGDKRRNIERRVFLHGTAAVRVHAWFVLMRPSARSPGPRLACTPPALAPIGGPASAAGTSGPAPDSPRQGLDRPDCQVSARGGAELSPGITG